MTLTIDSGIEVELIRNVTVVRFTAETLLESNFESISDELDALIHDQRPRRVVVDLQAVREVDDFGLAMVQSFHDSIEEFGGTAIVCRLTDPVKAALSASGLDRMLHIRPSLNDAIWTF
jgi:anti-anti-sigma factor